MGKLEQYAKKLEAKKAKARAYIEKMETLGFTVSESLKKTAYSATPERVTLKTLNNQPNLDLRRIQGSLARQMNKSTVGVTLHNPQNGDAILNGQFDLKITPKTIRDVNENLNNLKSFGPVNKIFQALYRSGKLQLNNKTVQENEDFILQPGWSAEDITEYLTIKKSADFSQRYLQDILSVPQTTTQGNTLYKNDAAHRSYLTNMNKLTKGKNAPLAGVSQSTIDKLEQIMNTSQAWDIAKKGAKDSEQVQENWATLYKAVDDLPDDDTTSLDEIITMIENEESLDAILSYVDDIIGG